MFPTNNNNLVKINHVSSATSRQVTQYLTEQLPPVTVLDSDNNLLVIPVTDVYDLLIRSVFQDLVKMLLTLSAVISRHPHHMPMKLQSYLIQKYLIQYVRVRFKLPLTSCNGPSIFKLNSNLV